MARLTVHLGGSLVAPIATPRRFPSGWRVRGYVEAGLTAPTLQPGTQAVSRRTSHASVVSAPSRHHLHSNGAVA
jgi:hypothetical protein